MSHVKRDDADVLRVTENTMSCGAGTLRNVPGKEATIKVDGKSTLTRREANIKPVNAIAVRYMQ